MATYDQNAAHYNDPKRAQQYQNNNYPEAYVQQELQAYQQNQAPNLQQQQMAPQNNYP